MAGLAVVGHIAIDKIIVARGERSQLGGPPTYVSLVADALGRSIMAVTAKRPLVVRRISSSWLWLDRR